MSEIRRELADLDDVVNQSLSARTSAINDARSYLLTQMSQLTATLAGASPYSDSEVLNVTGVKRVYGTGLYQLNTVSPGGLAPLGSGDGSDADQALLVSRVSGHAAQMGCSGGQGGTVRLVNTSADDVNGTTSGSLRNAILAHQTAWQLDQTAKSWIIFDPSHSPYNITLAADLSILSRNITIDGRGSIVNINGGGKPGPVPYGVLKSAHTSGATTLTLNSVNFNAAKLRVGMLVDVIAVDGTRSTVYGSNLIASAFDATAGTITLDPSTPLANSAPINAVVVYRGKTAGQLGHAINNGGKGFNDMFGPGKVNIPAGNIIWHNISVVSNWGGDVMDTGNANDFRTSYWTNPMWVDHCTFSNPDPFHDVMYQTGSGAGGLTVSWCYFHDHYKAINHFNGTNGTGGTNPDGTVSKTHSFPPKPGPDGSAGFYTTTDPGPYRWNVPPTTNGTHGNDANAPLVIETATWHHNYLLHLGNRSPKVDFFGEMHFYNNYVKEWGETSDPLSNGLQFDWPPGQPVTGGSGLQCINWASALVENNIFEPYLVVGGGGPHRAIATNLNNNPRGFVKESGNVYLNGAVIDSDVNGSNAAKVPVFGQRYAYTLNDANDTMKARILAGSGAGAQGAMWTYIGPATAAAGGTALTVKDEGTSLSSAVSSINVTGAGATATLTSPGAIQIDVPGAVGSSLAVKDEGSTLTSSAASINFVGANVAATTTAGAAITVTVDTVPGQLLAVTTYWPSTAQTAATTTSSTMHDIAADGVTAAWSSFTATSLDCVFTVPANRIIDVRLSLYTKASSAGSAVRVGVGDSTGTTLNGPNNSGTVANGTVEQRIEFTRRIDLSTIVGGGPAAGTTFTIRPQWQAGGSGTATLDVGGNGGPLSMRVFAAL